MQYGLIEDLSPGQRRIPNRCVSIQGAEIKGNGRGRGSDE